MHEHHQLNTSRQEVDEERAGMLQRLCVLIFPLWASQISAAKTLTNTSIEGLSTHFVGLSKHIRKITTNDQNQSSAELITLLNDGQQQLATVIDLLKNSIEEKKALLRAITDLSSSAKELGNMANTVSRISRETDMVAVNAAIEAARVGERGRSFAVVADAIKRLSTDAGKTGEHISETVLGVSKAIKSVTDISKEFEKKDAQTLIDAEQVVGTVVGKFGAAANAVVSTSQKMLMENKHVADEIDQVLYALQFQDRVNQMLTHVQQDISKLDHKIQEAAGVGDVDDWLDALKAGYTMREQNHIHQQKTAHLSPLHKNKPASKPANASKDSGEITFF